MAVKPDFIKWVVDDGAAKISDPGSTKSLAGFLYKEKPAFQFINWLFNRIFKWQLGLQGGFYDIVVGSAAEVTAHEATHELADLDDTLVVAGSRVLLLDGTHTLTGNLTLTNDDLKVTAESPLAIFDVDTYSAVFSGARNDIKTKVTKSAAGFISVTGAGSYFFGIDTPITIAFIGENSRALTTGVSGGQRPNGITGEIKTLPYDTIDHGLLLCDGGSYTTAAKPALFAKIGYTYGGAAANFNVPDYQGEFLRGQDNGAAVDPDAATRTDRGDGTTGDNVGTKQAEDYLAHTHVDDSDGTPILLAAGAGSALATGFPGVTGSAGGNETRPINTYVVFAICDGT